MSVEAVVAYVLNKGSLCGENIATERNGSSITELRICLALKDVSVKVLQRVVGSVLGEERGYWETHQLTRCLATYVITGDRGQARAALADRQ